MKSQRYAKYEADYLEIELEDKTFVGSPHRGLAERFPYILSIHRKLQQVGPQEGEFKYKQGKTIMDDFRAFEEYLYASDNELKKDKTLLFESEVREG